MKKQEKQLEVEVNGIPDLSKAPKDLLQLFFEAMLEAIELLNEECELGAATKNQIIFSFKFSPSCRSCTELFTEVILTS